MSDGAPVYSIGAVARMLGVSVATLRTWEDRYGIVVPYRSPGGHRLYTRDDVERLGFVATNVATGVQPAGAYRLLEERLAHGEPLRQGAGDDGVFVLLAEHNPHAAEVAEYFLRTEGYETVVANDLSAVDDCIAQRSPSVVVVDLLISGGKGLSLCERLKDHQGTRVLAISPLSSRDDALAAGADAFLKKPIDPLVLVSSVKDLLQRSAYLRVREAQ